MEATAALYRRLRDDAPHPGLVRRAEAEAAALDYLGAIAARVGGGEAGRGEAGGGEAGAVRRAVALRVTRPAAPV